MTIPTPPQAGSLPHVFTYPTYLFRKKMLKLFGGRIDIYGPDEQPLMVSLQKAFKLREDIRLYQDDTKSVELLTIKTRQIIDFSAAYDVTDPATGQLIGTLRRKGLKSIIRDTWEILDPAGQPIGKIEAASLIPQSFSITLTNGQEVAEAKQRFNPFILKIDLTAPTGANAALLDPRLAIAATTLLVLIEGRQS